MSLPTKEEIQQWRDTINTLVEHGDGTMTIDGFEFRRYLDAAAKQLAAGGTGLTNEQRTYMEEVAGCEEHDSALNGELIDHLVETHKRASVRLTKVIATHNSQAAEIARLTKERDKLQSFKDWVHSYLDTHGVPHHPPVTHGAAGCRIGDRMDWLMAERDTAVVERDRLKEQLEKLLQMGEVAAAKLARGAG